MHNYTNNANNKNKKLQHINQIKWKQKSKKRK